MNNFISEFRDYKHFKYIGFNCALCYDNLTNKYTIWFNSIKIMPSFYELILK